MTTKPEAPTPKAAFPTQDKAFETPDTKAAVKTLDKNVKRKPTRLLTFNDAAAPVSEEDVPARREPTKAATGNPGSKIIKVFRLKHRQPKEMTGIVRSFLEISKSEADLQNAKSKRPDVAMTIDDRTRSLIIRGTMYQVADVAKLVVALDVSPKDAPITGPGSGTLTFQRMFFIAEGTEERPILKSVKIFRLKHRDQLEMMALVYGILKSSGLLTLDQKSARKSGDLVVTVMKISRELNGSGSLNLSGGLRLMIDRRTRSLLIGGSQETVDEVAKLMTAFDVPPQDAPISVTVFDHLQVLTFRHRSANEIYNILKGLGIRVKEGYGSISREQYLTVDGPGPGVITQVWPAPSRMTIARKPTIKGILTVSGSEADFKQIEELIKALDVESVERFVISDSPIGLKVESKYRPQVIQK